MFKINLFFITLIAFNILVGTDIVAGTCGSKSAVEPSNVARAWPDPDEKEPCAPEEGGWERMARENAERLTEIIGGVKKMLLRQVQIPGVAELVQEDMNAVKSGVHIAMDEIERNFQEAMAKLDQDQHDKAIQNVRESMQRAKMAVDQDRMSFEIRHNLLALGRMDVIRPAVMEALTKIETLVRNMVIHHGLEMSDLGGESHMRRQLQRDMQAAKKARKRAEDAAAQRGVRLGGRLEEPEQKE